MKVSERILFWVGGVLLALHLVDEAVLNPAAGTGFRDHRVLLLLAALVVALSDLYMSFGPTFRAALLFPFVPFAGVGGALHVQNALLNGPHGSDLSGFLLVPATLAFLGAGYHALRARGRPRSKVRWVLGGVGVVVSVLFVSLPVGVGVAQTRKPPREVPESAFALRHETVTFETRDGLELAGWYVPSRNQAAVVVVHGGGGDRRGGRRHAELLARHGYGVLLYDARGRGESEGSPNAQGWTWLADVDAAMAYVAFRDDVDPRRIGGLGLSTGADAMIEAAAKRPRLQAIVADGATARSLADVRRAGALDAVLGLPYWAVVQGTVAVLDQSWPPEPLVELAARIAPKPALFIASKDLGEPRFNRAYAEAYGIPDSLWLVDAGHTKALAEEPREYERRVIALFDGALLRDTDVGFSE